MVAKLLRSCLLIELQMGVEWSSVVNVTMKESVADNKFGGDRKNIWKEAVTKLDRTGFPNFSLPRKDFLTKTYYCVRATLGPNTAKMHPFLLTISVAR